MHVAEILVTCRHTVRREGLSCLPRTLCIPVSPQIKPRQLQKRGGRKQIYHVWGDLFIYFYKSLHNHLKGPQEQVQRCIPPVSVVHWVSPAWIPTTHLTPQDIQPEAEIMLLITRIN